MKVFHYDNCVVRVHNADISEQEKERRMKMIKAATEQLLKARLKNGKENR